MGLPEFCRAVYKRKSPITNQAKFVQAVFQHAGSAERLDDEYARKIFTGANRSPNRNTSHFLHR